MHRIRRETGFTVIELLVVITIIVVLMTVLAPALENAVYQAELTMCGGRLKAMAVGLTTGAVDRQRKYPARTDGTSANHVAHNLTIADGFDARPQLESYLSDLNTILQCPLNQEVDLAGSTNAVDIFSSYELWFGWQYLGINGGKAMTRIGDKLEYGRQQYNILAQDIELLRVTTSPIQTWGSHPDRGGVLRAFVSEQRRGHTSTVAAWVDSTGTPRGLSDLNVVYQDVAVVRFDSVQTHGPAFNRQDERFDAIGYWRSGANFPGERVFVPRH